MPTQKSFCSNEKATRQNHFCKHVELCMISLDGGSNVVHDSPPDNLKSMYTPIRWQQRFQNYEKAYLILEDALRRTLESPDDRLLQAGCLQTYEFTIELAWKTLKDYLEEKGVLAMNPSDVIRDAFQQEYIGDGELWLEALKARNLSSHAYNEKVAADIMKNIRERYFSLLTALYDFFKKQIGQ